MTDSAVLDAIGSHQFPADRFLTWLQDKIVGFLDSEGLVHTEFTMQSVELKIKDALGLCANLTDIAHSLTGAQVPVEDVERQLGMIVDAALEQVPGADVGNVDHREAAYDALYASLQWERRADPDPSPSLGS